MIYCGFFIQLYNYKSIYHICKDFRSFDDFVYFGIIENIEILKNFVIIEFFIYLIV